MTWFTSQVPFFYGRVTSPRTKDSFFGRATSRSFGYKSAYLSTPTSVLKTEDSFSNFLSRKGIILALKGLANHLSFFLLPQFPPVRLLGWPGFFSSSNRLQVMECGQALTFILTWILYCSTGCRSWSASNWLSFISPFLTASLWGLLVQTQKGRGIDITFPLSVAYHVTITLFTSGTPYKNHDSAEKFCGDFFSILSKSHSTFHHKVLKTFIYFVRQTVYL